MDDRGTQGSRGAPGSSACVGVDAVLARRMLAHPRRDRALRLLLAIAQDQDVRNTEIPGVSHARLDDGIAIASIALAPGARWRAGNVSIGGALIPETVAVRLAGRPLSVLLDHPDIAGATIVRASNRKIGVDATATLAAVDYCDLWRRLGG